MKLKFHRKEQWDLECYPILCAHLKTADRSSRVFCLWFWGIQIGKFSFTPKSIRLKNKVYKFR